VRAEVQGTSIKHERVAFCLLLI